MAKILKKVMLEEEFKDGTTMWRVPCECHAPAHDAQLWFELDEHGIMALRITTEVGFYNYSYDDSLIWERFNNGLGRAWKRIKAASSMLFKGYYTFEGEVSLREDGILGLQFALTEGVVRAKEAEKAYQKKRNAEIVKEMNGAM